MHLTQKNKKKGERNVFFKNTHTQKKRERKKRKNYYLFTDVNKKNIII